MWNAAELFDKQSLPHAIEPKYPGAFETIIDFSTCWDSGALYDAQREIVTLAQSCSRCHDHCCRFLSAAGSLVGDSYRIALDCVKTQKLTAYCDRLCDRELKSLKNRTGKERVRFLSAITNEGSTCFTDSALQLCERIYLINDDYGAVTRLLLHTLRPKILAAGYDIISCYCPLSPYEKLEHLFIPELSVGFLTSNHYHDFSEKIDPYRIVNSQRFTDTAALREGKRRLSFNRKAAGQMLQQAHLLLRDAKSLHDELEGYYIHATDFGLVDALTERTLQMIGTY